MSILWEFQVEGDGQGVWQKVDQPADDVELAAEAAAYQDELDSSFLWVRKEGATGPGQRIQIEAELVTQYLVWQLNDEPPA